MSTFTSHEFIPHENCSGNGNHCVFQGCGLPRGADVHNVKFALSGQCYSKVHVNCPYPERCRCKCHSDSRQLDDTFTESVRQAGHSPLPWKANTFAVYDRDGVPATHTGACGNSNKQRVANAELRRSMLPLLPLRQ